MSVRGWSDAPIRTPRRALFYEGPYSLRTCSAGDARAHDALLAATTATAKIQRANSVGLSMITRLAHILIATLSLVTSVAGAQSGQTARVDSIFAQFSTGLTP